MDRRDFFRRIGIMSLGVIVVPIAVVEVVKKITKPPKVLWGFIVPKRRRSGAHVIRNHYGIYAEGVFIHDLPNPKLIKNLYRKYGNQKMNYFELLKSLNSG